MTAINVTTGQTVLCGTATQAKPHLLWNVITGNPEIPVLLVWATDKQDARFKAGVKMGTGYYSNFRCIEA